MSWQLGAFAILGLGLIGGFAWYERTGPDARIVALVGTLAAFGALGRIAFAAVPNVKPTGDIVLIAGYTLGGAPGFVVGSVSALASNMFFGQGPWTPWQMAGWGVTGVLGAGLAYATRGRIARWPLALICFVLGFAFTAFQDFGTWVNYSNHSLAELGVLVGQGLGFDLIYASGCLLFALAFGPALIRALRRVRQRLTGTWLPLPGEDPLPGHDPLSGDAPLPGHDPLPDDAPPSGAQRPHVRPSTTLLVALAAITLSFGAALMGGHPVPARAASVPRKGAPYEYLFRAENRNGGVPLTPGQPSSTLASGWAALALAAAPHRLEFAHRAGHPSLIDYIEATVRQDTDPGSIERTILALRAAGVPVRSVDGVPLLHQLQRLIGSDGSVDQQTNLTAFAVLALRAAGARVAPRTIAWLARQQDGDGGFNFETGGRRVPSDPDDTGAALEALAATGHRRLVRRAVSYLREQQNRDGGLPAQSGGFSNAQSTAFAIEGLVAAGVKLSSFHKPGGANPLAYLRRLTLRSGALEYSSGNTQTPVWVTAESELGLARRALPIVPARSRAGSRPAGVTTAASKARQRKAPTRVKAGKHYRTARPTTGGRDSAHAERRAIGGIADSTGRLLLSLIRIW